MLDRDALLKGRDGQEDIEIEGVGTVRVRPLTRGEALQVANKSFDAAEIERKIVAWGLVEPTLSEEDVKSWQDSSPAGEIQTVVDAIVRLSGMEKHAAKQAYQQFRE